MQFTAAFEGILAAAKGSSGEKRLAAGFIPKFFNSFPDLSDQSMDALFDLVEDEDPLVSVQLFVLFGMVLVGVW